MRIDLHKHPKSKIKANCEWDTFILGFRFTKLKKIMGSKISSSGPAQAEARPLQPNLAL